MIHVLIKKLDDRVLERNRIENRYLKINERFSIYKDIVSKREFGQIESTFRTLKISHFNNFLEWCELNHYDYFEWTEHEKTNILFNMIRAELNDLNYVIEGSMIGPYKIIKTIGSGGYGTVYKVESKDYNIKALKVFHTSNFNISELVKRFKRGFEYMKILNHDQITSVSDFFLAPRGYIMDYIEGKNLQDFTEDKYLMFNFEMIQDRLSLMCNICHIVEYAHKQHVMHRDLKPQNIIMRWSTKKNSYEPVITDFDLAWYAQADQLTIAGSQIVGSLLYSPPEQRSIHKHNELIHKPTVDVFSLGRLLYFFVTKETPSENVDMPDFLLSELKNKFKGTNSNSFPHLIRNIFIKATDVDPKKRYQKVRNLRLELERVLSLLGKIEKGMGHHIFLLELGLKLNFFQDYEEIEKNAKEGFVLANFGSSKIKISFVEVDKNYYYLDIQIKIDSDAGLALSQKKTFQKARKTWNDRIEKCIKKSDLNIVNPQPGGSGEIYSFKFRLYDMDFSLSDLENFCELLNSIKYIFAM